jgi:transcriptional regulator with XRE-family HTH domain
MSVATITDALGFTRNYWSAVENDRTLIAEDKLHQLFDILEFEEPDRTELLELREASRQKGWWDDYSHLLSREMKRFYGLEDGASRINAYDSNIIPGILQTEAYRRSVLEADPAFAELQIDDLLSMREHRQSLLKRRQPPEITALVSEAALRQQLNDRTTHVQQLDHVIQLTEEHAEHLNLRVLPFDVSPGLIMQSATLLIFEFDSTHLPAVVCQEAVRVLDFIEADDDEFRRLQYSWEDGIDRSLTPLDSVQFLMDIRSSTQ